MGREVKVDANCYLKSEKTFFLYVPLKERDNRLDTVDNILEIRSSYSIRGLIQLTSIQINIIPKTMKITNFLDLIVNLLIII